jgi:hypothetical protein
MKCVNCGNDALYQYKISEVDSMFYCGTHLPRFLESQRKAGSLSITAAFTALQEEVFASLAPVVEEAPAEEVVAEEVPVKVTKKTAAKKSVEE